MRGRMYSVSQVTFLRVSLILEVAWEPDWPLPPGRALLLSLCLHSFISKVGGRVPHMALWESDHGLLTEKVDVPREGERRDHLLVGSDRPGPQGAQTAGGFSVSVSEAAARFPSAGRGEARLAPSRREGRCEGRREPSFPHDLRTTRNLSRQPLGISSRCSICPGR